MSDRLNNFKLTILSRQAAEKYIKETRKIYEAGENGNKDIRLSHILSILDASAKYVKDNAKPIDNATWLGNVWTKYTHVAFDDIIQDIETEVAPNKEHMTEVIKLIKRAVSYYDSLPDRANLLIHCHAGISRSTAAGLIALNSLMGPGHEEACMKRLLEIAPQAWPNSLMIKIADEMLNRNNKMVESLYLAEARIVKGYSW